MEVDEIGKKGKTVLFFFLALPSSLPPSLPPSLPHLEHKEKVSYDQDFVPAGPSSAHGLT